MTWLGYVDAPVLSVLYRLARAVVVPTLFEAASAPVWEAFEAGVPVACSSVTSLPEQVGDAAVLFDPLDVDAIAGAIARVWSDEELRRVLIRRGHERMAGRSWRATALTFRAHYRRLARRRLSDEDRDLLAVGVAI